MTEVRNLFVWCCSLTHKPQYHRHSPRRGRSKHSDKVTCIFSMTSCLILFSCVFYCFCFFLLISDRLLLFFLSFSQDHVTRRNTTYVFYDGKYFLPYLLPVTMHFRQIWINALMIRTYHSCSESNTSRSCLSSHDVRVKYWWYDGFLFWNRCNRILMSVTESYFHVLLFYTEYSRIPPIF